MRKTNKGITLIALIITVIVMLILVGVTVSVVINSNLIGTAQNAADRTQIAYEEEADVIDNILKDMGIVDWEKAKAEAVAPASQDEARNNGVIGIGANGNPVDMDLWEYELDAVTGGYGLNDATSLATEASADASAGYLGEDFTNINIPQYISKDNGATWTAVTNLDWTFFYSTELLKISRIPDTVISMRYTFRGCSNMSDMPKLPVNLENMLCTFYGCTTLKNTTTIPNSVTNMKGTFNKCSSLEIAPKIPQNVTNMQQTFQNCVTLEKSPIIPKSVINMQATFNGCSSLEIAPEIPNGVTNMYATFIGCTALEKGPSTIPSSVDFLYHAFRGCTKLTGTIEIKANITGKKVLVDEQDEILDYKHCFSDAATSGQELTLKCTESIYNLFNAELQKTVTTGSDNMLCSSTSNIKLEKIAN